LPTANRQQQTAQTGRNERQHSHHDRCTTHRVRRASVLGTLPHAHPDPSDDRGNRDSQWDGDL
jgi:hypothetical protein